MCLVGQISLSLSHRPVSRPPWRPCRRRRRPSASWTRNPPARTRCHPPSNGEEKKSNYFSPHELSRIIFFFLDPRRDSGSYDRGKQQQKKMRLQIRDGMCHHQTCTRHYFFFCSGKMTESPVGMMLSLSLCPHFEICLSSPLMSLSNLSTWSFRRSRLWMEKRGGGGGLNSSYYPTNIWHR